MTTSVIPGYGTILKRGDGATTEVFTAIAEVTEFNPPEISLKTDEATHHGSGGWEEHIGTLLSGGEIGVKVNWLPSDATQDEEDGMLHDLLNRRKGNWQAILPGGAKGFQFTALVTKFKPSTPVDKKMSAEFTLKVSGAVSTFTPS